MKCPYCAEEIKDEAIVCRYCGRDLVLLKPIFERLDSLESELSKLNTSFEQERLRLETAVQSLQSGRVSQPLTSTPTNTDFSWIYALPIILAVILYYYGSYAVGLLPSDSFGIAFAVSPLPLGAWLGLQWRGSHLKWYIVSGLIIGLAGVFGDWSYYGDIVIEFAAFIILMATLSFTTGGIVGDWIERVRYGRPDVDGYSEKLARRLIEVRQISSGGSETSSEDRIQRLSDVISAMTPVLTFIASIVATILTFVAAQGSRGN